MNKFFRKLLGRIGTKPPNPLAHVPAWSDLDRACMALHIADASNVKKGRKGWDAAYGRTG